MRLPKQSRQLQPFWLRLALVFVLTMSHLARGGNNIVTRPPEVLRRSRQCLVVSVRDWSSTSGQVRLFERDKGDAPWQPRGANIAVMLGKNGLGWGRGAVAFDRPGPIKKEGDGRAPAGVFRLGTVFGYARTKAAPPMKMRYFALTQESEAVDDPQSRYYNQLLERDSVPRPDWRSSEKMRSDDIRYRWGIFVRQNTPPVAGAGSCIFLHVWLSPQTRTVGCTAMAESDLKRIIAWLDPAARPLLIQLPRAEFRRFEPTWFPDVHFSPTTVSPGRRD